MALQNKNLTASELINQMRKAGFVVTLNGNKVNVKESRRIDAELAALITHHKYDLISLLKLDLAAYREHNAITLLHSGVDVKRGIYVDHDAMPANVLVTIAIKDKEVDERAIPKSKWNSYKVFALADMNGDKYSEGAFGDATNLKLLESEIKYETNP